MAKVLYPATGEAQTRPLTTKQEAFALAVIELGNASAAYRKVYDCKPDIKPNTVEKRACELMQCGKVAGRIAELQSRAAAKVVLSRSWVLEQLMDNATKAKKEGVDDFTASNKALELLGKTDELRMFTERIENEDGPNRAKATAEDRSRTIELIGRLGLGASSQTVGGRTQQDSEAEFPILREHH